MTFFVVFWRNECDGQPKPVAQLNCAIFRTSAKESLFQQNTRTKNKENVKTLFNEVCNNSSTFSAITFGGIKSFKTIFLCFVPRRRNSLMGW